MQDSNPKIQIFKEQTQPHPGLEAEMDPQPEFETPGLTGHKMIGKRCIVTGGDSGIGRAVSIAFAKEGADVAIIYLEAEREDAHKTAEIIEGTYRKTCIMIPADISKEENCKEAIDKITGEFETIDVLVNNAAVHYPKEDLLEITSEQLLETFQVNVFSMFWITQRVLPHMKKGGSIINTTSVVAYRGSGGLIDYSATKGAIVSFTRSLAANLADKGIRVNGVAPGPIWTPLVPASFPGEKVAVYGTDTPMKRPGQPGEVAPAYVFLASQDTTYMTGQVIHVNGGEIING